MVKWKRLLFSKILKCNKQEFEVFRPRVKHKRGAGLQEIAAGSAHPETTGWEQRSHARVAEAGWLLETQAQPGLTETPTQIPWCTAGVGWDTGQLIGLDTFIST